jgi:hypothetical protein
VADLRDALHLHAHPVERGDLDLLDGRMALTRGLRPEVGVGDGAASGLSNRSQVAWTISCRL